jgi:hypothetical protein
MNHQLLRGRIEKGKMKVLIACEFSGIVREAFRKRGHDAWSCDLLPTEIPGQHIQGDVLAELDNGWDLMIAHPPCTYLTTTGNKWMSDKFKVRFPDRWKQRQSAVDFFLKLYNSKVNKIAIENPVGIMSTCFRKPDQYIHPHMFGDRHAKKTCLWLDNLPLLKPTKIVEPEYYIYKDGRRDPIWHVESMKLKPQERMKERSRTFQGIANAMAEQWG